MTVSDVWDDIPAEEYVPKGGTKFHYLISYDTSTGEWSVDNDSIFVPDSPVYDPEKEEWRKLHIDEITRDGELMGALKSVLKRLRYV